jgi:hypothetical protein
VAPFHSIIKCHVSSPYSTTIIQPELSTLAARVYHHATSLPHVSRTDCPVNIFFACLTFRSERDIFSIRTPFDIKYHRNREDETDAMVLVSSDSENFHFLAFSCPDRLLNPISDQNNSCQSLLKSSLCTTKIDEKVDDRKLSNLYNLVISSAIPVVRTCLRSFRSLITNW